MNSTFNAVFLKVPCLDLSYAASSRSQSPKYAGVTIYLIISTRTIHNSISYSNHLKIGLTYRNDSEDCLADISSWMCSNMLKLNEDKTEVMLFAPKHRVKDLQDCHLTFGGNVVTSSECVKNLGVYFDKTLSMNQQVSSVSKSCFHQIRNIGRIHVHP